MLYKPTSPSPYAQCIALDSTTEITNDGLLKYYIIEYQEDSGKYLLKSTGATGGYTYVYPVKENYGYTIRCNKNSYFRVGYSETKLDGEGEITNVVYNDELSSYFFYNTIGTGYIYVNFTGASMTSYTTVSVTERKDDKISFLCSMLGGNGVETSRLKISNSNTQYYFDNRIILDTVGEYVSNLSSNAVFYSGGGITKVYPVKNGYKYSIKYENCEHFILAWHSGLTEGTKSGVSLTPLEAAVTTEPSKGAYEFENAYGDGYLYVCCLIDSVVSPVLTNETVEVEAIPCVDKPFDISSRNSCTLLQHEMNINTSYDCYVINNLLSPERTYYNLSFGGILETDENYTWQARLYDKESFNDNYRGNIWLAYGVTQSVDKSDYSNGEKYYYINRAYNTCAQEDATCICIKVRPHLNMIFPNSTGGTETLSISSNRYDMKKLYRYHDNNAKYCIKINNKYYAIRDYRFYPPARLSTNSLGSSDVDSYGEPLYGYIVIDYVPGSDDVEPIVNIGEQYEIYCNYVDSDEYYFNVVTKPTLTLVGANGAVFEGTKENPTHMSCSNLVLVGVYNHMNGAKIEKYNVVLYDANENILDETGYICSSDIAYSYGLLRTAQGIANSYKVEITAYDSLGYKVEKEIYLSVGYDEFSLIANIEASYYAKHDSVIVEIVSSNKDSIDNFLKSMGRFDIYKKIGNNPKLHKVLSITQPSNSYVIEDFAVGNLCDYTYCVYPVVDNKGENYAYSYVITPLVSNTIHYNQGTTVILGLVQDEKDLHTYTIDYNEMWRFEFNLENTGSTLNIDKTFTDTQHQFPKMTGGSRKYNTIPVKGLIGYYDCKKDDYVENYDLLEDWERFVTNNRLKLLKDRRGRLVPCDIETSSDEYMDVLEAPTIVSFSTRQLESMDNITILGRTLLYNPVKYNLLTTSDNEIITDSDTQILTSQEG